MEIKKALLKKMKEGNWFIMGVSMFITVVLVININILYNFNDDTMILSILSGRFTPNPDGHSIYLLYPLGVLLATCYRFFPDISWFGIFLVGSYSIGIGLITIGISRFFKKGTVKAPVVFLCFLVLYGLLIRHIALIHYTLVSAFLGGTGLFWFAHFNYEDCSGKQVLKKNIISIILLLLCFLLRENVFYMALPFLLVAGLWKILETKKTNVLVRLGKWIPLLGVFALGFIFLWGWNKQAYSSEKWVEYKEYNEARTYLYDYAGIPRYDVCYDAFQKHNLTTQDGTLIASYALLYSDNITTDALHDLSDAAIKSNNLPWKAALIRSFKEYIVQNLKGNFAPYTPILIVLYLGIYIILVVYKKWSYLGLLVTQIFIRSGIWIYLLYKGRFPERISDSLMILELLMLFGILLSLISSSCIEPVKTSVLERSSFLGNKAKAFGLVVGILVTGVLTYGVVNQYQEYKLTYQEVAKFNKGYEKLVEYCQENQDKVFFLDANSVYFGTEAVFAKKTPVFENFLLAGGWVLESPLLEEKLQALGFDSSESLLKQVVENPQCYFVFHKNNSYQWLTEYINSKRGTVLAPEPELSLTSADVVTLQGVKVYNIVKILEAK